MKELIKTAMCKIPVNFYNNTYLEKGKMYQIIVPERDDIRVSVIDNLGDPRYVTLYRNDVDTYFDIIITIKESLEIISDKLKISNEEFFSMNSETSVQETYFKYNDDIIILTYNSDYSGYIKYNKATINITSNDVTHRRVININNLTKKHVESICDFILFLHHNKNNIGV